MTKYIDEINYDNLVEKSLKNVAIEALKIAETQGLPGEHHYYITFKTTHPRVSISDQLKEQYPEEMTIVIQHQYFDLKVGSEGFSIGLSFGGIPQTLKISYDSITYFADPYAKFGLSFTTNENELPQDNLLDNLGSLEEPKKVVGTKATVVSIDAFRKK